MVRLLIALLVLLACDGPAMAAMKKATVKAIEKAEEEKPPEYNTIVLQGLNKVTGHISRLEGPMGTTLRFGNLEIVPRRCWKSSPEERPENAALLDISELKPGEAAQRIFLGWMFSSSPGLSGLEHAVYDITVLGCEYRKEPEADEAPAEDKKPDDRKKPDAEKKP